MAEPIPEVHAINAALLDIEGAGQLARAMDVGLLTERQARTAGEPRLAPDGRAQPLMFGTVECWDAIVRGDRRGFGKRGGGRPDDDDHRGADDDGARSEDACQEGPPEYCA
ncbi:MAG: hypothetical protein WKF45_05595, partial [Ilumatobacteraceae bacterium]